MPSNESYNDLGNGRALANDFGVNSGYFEVLDRYRVGQTETLRSSLALASATQHLSLALASATQHLSLALAQH